MVLGIRSLIESWHVSPCSLDCILPYWHGNPLVPSEKHCHLCSEGNQDFELSLMVCNVIWNLSTQMVLFMSSWHDLGHNISRVLIC